MIKVSWSTEKFGLPGHHLDDSGKKRRLHMEREYYELKRLVRRIASSRKNKKIYKNYISS